MLLLVWVNVHAAFRISPTSTHKHDVPFENNISKECYAHVGYGFRCFWRWGCCATSLAACVRGLINENVEKVLMRFSTLRFSTLLFHDLYHPSAVSKLWAAGCLTSDGLAPHGPDSAGDVNDAMLCKGSEAVKAHAVHHSGGGRGTGSTG
eukprot:5563770-Amphidinium_carterae.1